MKILVTGANGYLGQGVVKQLLDDGYSVIATDFVSTLIDTRAKIVTGDIFEIEDPFDYFEQPDCLLHLAWRNGFVHNANSHICDLPSHYYFIEKLVKSGIKQVAVMGSMHEVGFYEGSISEITPTNPMNLYGISKNALRNSIKFLCDNHKIVYQWLRGFYIVGNSEAGSSIFSKIAASENQEIDKFPFTTGQNQYDFIDYDQFCLQVASTVEQKEINGIVNICSGYPEKLVDRVERFIKENNYKISLDYGKFPDRIYDSKAIWGSNKKIELILKRKFRC